MKVLNPTSKAASGFCSIPNLSHLFAVYNINSILVETASKLFAKEVLQTHRKKPLVHYVPVRYFESSGDQAELLYSEESTLLRRYDLIIVSESMCEGFLPVLHRGLFILVRSGTVTGDVRSLVPYAQLNGMLEGTLFINDLHSIPFPSLNAVNMYEKSFVRDMPHRFLRKAIAIAPYLLPRKATVIEIGSVNAPISHSIGEVNAACCSANGHSTAFLCGLDCQVITVDVSANCRSILEEGLEAGFFDMKGSVSVRKEEGLTFLQRYVRKVSNASIDMLVLDAFYGENEADKYLEAYQTAEPKLAQTSMLLLSDTDSVDGGKGSHLIPQAVRDGYIVLFQGRMTLLYRGALEHLFRATRSIMVAQ